MNKRLDIVARTMMSLATSDGVKVKTLDEYRKDAAVILASVDTFLFSAGNVERAVIDAGYEPAEHTEQFAKIISELNDQKEDTPRFFLTDMQKAWAKGHENGFWDARQTDAVKPAPVAPTESKTFFSEDDLKNAEAQGYVSGWQNGVLSETVMEASEKLLLGAQHEKATNPYSAENAAVSAAQESTEGHALWCAGNHEGECKRGQVTGTEKSADND
jgi:hypothetical protein